MTIDPLALETQEALTVPFVHVVHPDDSGLEEGDPFNRETGIRTLCGVTTTVFHTYQAAHYQKARYQESHRHPPPSQRARELDWCPACDALLGIGDDP